MTTTAPVRIALSVRDASKVYRSRSGDVQALAPTSFDVPDGEIWALVGPSGCGKSTLLRMLAGLMRPTTGSLHLGGEQITGASRRVGMMFQQPALLEWRTILANVTLPLDVARRPRSESVPRALELLESVGLKDFAASRPSELSGGMRQRVALCRALVTDPDVLLLDEPFGALDSITREQLNDLVLRECKTRGKTAILVTHDIDEAVYLADEVLVMSPRPGRVSHRTRFDFPFPRDYHIRTSKDFETGILTIRDALSDAFATL